MDRHQISQRERDFYDAQYATLGVHAIQDPIWVPRAIDLNGKRVLICGCGRGVEAVRASRAGAKVFAFDIAPNAIEQTRRLAEFNHVEVTAEVMDFCHLTYSDDFFDVAYGSAVLHHVDCALAGVELFRCLKPGGVAVFFENSDMNPLIRWFRRAAFGSPGGFQKERFLFFHRFGTSDEYPLTEHEIGTLARIFQGHVTVQPAGFAFFRVLARHTWNAPKVSRVTRWVDRFLGSTFPSVQKYSFWQWIILEKPRALSAPLD